MAYQPSSLFIGQQTEHFLRDKFLPKRWQTTATRGKNNRISITNEAAFKANICQTSHGEKEYLNAMKINDVSKQTSPAGRGGGMRSPYRKT